MTEDKLMPHDIDAERAVLGSVLVDPDSIFEIERLRGVHFYKKTYGKQFEVMRSMRQRGVEVDIVTLGDEFDAAGVDYDIVELTGLLVETPTSSHIKDYARVVESKWQRRNIINTAGKLAKIAYDDTVSLSDVIEGVSKALLDISVDESTPDSVNAKKGASALLDEIATYYADGGVSTGLLTGYKKLDELLRGMQKGGFYVLAARPGMGKTALATNIVERVARKGKRVLFFSMEMSNKQVLGRMVAQMARTTYNDTMEGRLSADEMRAVMDAGGQISTFDIEFHDTPGITLSQIFSKSMRDIARGPVDLIVIDHLGLMESEGRQENRTNTVSAFSRGLKVMAKALNIPVLALSQLSRAVETRQDKHPQLSDLRDSGSIEQDADAVMFIYRDAYYANDILDDDEPDTDRDNRIAEIDLAKNRFGPTGIVELIFDGYCGSFDDIAVKAVTSL